MVSHTSFLLLSEISNPQLKQPQILVRFNLYNWFFFYNRGCDSIQLSIIEYQNKIDW